MDNILGTESRVPGILQWHLRLHVVRPPDAVCKRQEVMRITVIAAATFVARADGWRVSFAAAAAVAVVANGVSNSVSHGGQKRFKNRGDGIMEWALKMRRKHTMFKGERQCPTFNRNSIGSGRIEGAPGLRMRRAADASS